MCRAGRSIRRSRLFPESSVRKSRDASTCTKVRDRRTLSAAATDLFSVHGGWSYLVKLRGAVAVELAVKGRPVLKAPRWMPDAFRLVSFDTATQSPSSLRECLRYSSAHNPWVFSPWAPMVGGRLLLMGMPCGEWPIGRPCRGPSDYGGPITVIPDHSTGLLKLSAGNADGRGGN